MKALVQIAAAITAISVILGGLAWAGDSRWITIGGLQELFEAQEAQELRYRIRELEWDADHGGLSEKDEYLLEQCTDDLEALE